MKKTAIKILSLIIAIAMFTVLVAGCDQATETSSETSQSQAEATPTTTPAESTPEPTEEPAAEFDGTYFVKKAASAIDVEAAFDVANWANATKVELSYENFIVNSNGASIYEINMGEDGIETVEPRSEGMMYLMWDEGGMYFAAEMTDESIHIFQPYGGQGNIQDGIQFCVNTSGNLETQDLNTAYIFDLSPVSGEDKTGPASWFEHFQHKGNNPDIDLKMSGALTDTGYVMQGYIPWEAFQAAEEDFTADVGYSFGFGMLVIDFNADAQLNDLYFDFGEGLNTIGDPSTWNMIELVE